MTEAELVIDAVGRLCPLPVIELAKRIGEVPVGALVAVVCDDPAAVTDIPAWCRMREQEYVGAQPGADGVTHLIRRTH